jgi:tetratricopeptide (TPR) repeat protein
MYYSLDDHQRALEYLLRSYRISKEVGSDLGISYTSNNLGIVYLGIGEPKKALEFFHQDLRIAIRDGTKRRQARALYNIGTAWLKGGEYEKARQALEPSIKILARSKDRVRLQNALHRLAVAIAPDKRNRRRALALIKRSGRLSRMTGPRSEIAAVHASHAKVMGFMNNPAKVRLHFEKALEIYRKDGLRRLEADTYVEYGRTLMLLPRSRRPGADFIRGLFARARVIYQRLRIDRKIEDVERLLKMTNQGAEISD